jgi:predicted ferric reductase
MCRRTGNSGDPHARARFAAVPGRAHDRPDCGFPAFFQEPGLESNSGLGDSVSHLNPAVAFTGDRRALSRPDVVYVLFFANAALIVGFWWFSSGFEIARNPSDLFNGLGRITGLLGTYLVLCQLLSMARTAWLEAALGFEKMAVFHRWNGFGAITLLLAHAVFQTVGYALGDGKNVLAQFGDFIANYEGLLGATAGLVLMVAVVAVSIAIARRHMAYETWYYVHLYAYLAVALAFIHQLATGVDFAGNPVFVYYWCLLYVYVFGNLLLHRVAKPLATFNRHRFRVHQVRREARGVFSVYITGRNMDRFPAQPGQFAIWRFLDRTRWWQAHPFSISAIPDGRRLRITVKNIGDFTSGVHGLKPGTPVLVEGPFGKFTERPSIRKVLLIAGGIGITPIRPLAEEMAMDGFDVRVLYRAHSRADVIFKDELDAVAARHGVRLDYLLTDDGTRKRARDGWFRPESLAQLVPEIRQRAVYVCGPVHMREFVLASMHKLGVPSGQIRTEAFRLS